MKTCPECGKESFNEYQMNCAYCGTTYTATISSEEKPQAAPSINGEVLESEEQYDKLAITSCMLSLALIISNFTGVVYGLALMVDRGYVPKETRIIGALLIVASVAVFLLSAEAERQIKLSGGKGRALVNLSIILNVIFICFWIPVFFL